VIAAVGGDAYNVVLILHILTAIVGFGAVLLNGIYGAQVKAHLMGGRVAEGLAVYEANYKVSKIGQLFIYAVPLLGFGLVGLSDDAIDFGDLWVWLSVVLYVVALGISHGLLMPRVRRMGVLMREMAAGPPPAGGPPPQAAQLAAIGPQIGMIAMTLDVFLVAILSLMVFKPL
jgi:hypothetical protein